MNKQEQIEEMANIPHKCIKSSCEDCIKNDRKCADYKQAEALYIQITIDELLKEYEAEERKKK